ncbi:MAG TPA: hypothetical protein VGI93_05350 [Steroidobacteraceae bacterium]
MHARIQELSDPPPQIRQLLLVRSLRGYRPLCFIPDGLLLARGYELLAASLDCSKLRSIGEVPHSLHSRLLRRARLAERVLRLGIRFGVRIGEGSYLLAERNRLWRLSLPSGQIVLDQLIEKGTKPLWISRLQGVKGFTDGACYGEYWDNVRRDPVNVWARNLKGEWRIAHTFDRGTIEHVHGMFPDPHRGLVWIVTGDLGGAAGIWAARQDFREVFPVLVGQQRFRCCWLAISARNIVYATDSPLARNTVRELVLPSGCWEGPGPWRGVESLPLMETSGSSIYGCKLADEAVFSTTVEPGLPTGHRLRDWFERKPGPGILGPYADLMVGGQAGFVRIGRWQKDRWPYRLCEFGSICFPTGVNPGNRIYAYGTGLIGADGQLDVYDLKVPPRGSR